MATINIPGGGRTTIQAGINAATNGDTVLVAAGTYNEKVTINKSITVKTTAGAKIRGNGQLVYISANNATFDGFTVERIKWESGRNDIVEVRGSGVTVKNCTVYVANVTNLAAATAAFGKEKASGIIVKSNNATVENCEVWGACFGVAFSDNAGRNSVVRNCNLHHTIQSCLRINYSYTVRGLLVESCNLNYSYGEDGIQWQQDFGGAQGKATISNRGTFVRNCVLIGNGENAFDLKGADGHTIEGCLMTQTVGDNNGLIDGSGQSISGTIGRGSNARSQNVRFRNCVVWNSKNGMNVFGPDFYYYNNTYIWNNYSFKGSNSFNGSGYDLRSSYANCGFRNNLVAGHRGPQASVRANGSLDMDYNVYCTNGGNFEINDAGKNWDTWRAGLRAAGVNGADGNSKHYTAWSSILLTNCPEKPGNLSGYNFLPQASSPAYQAGGPLTTCAGSGNSNRVPVKNAGWFCDGYGAPGVKGDTVTIGGTTATITAINGDTLTLNKTVNFTNGMGVYWGGTNNPHIGVMDLADLPPTDPDPEPEGDITANFTANKARVETGTTVTFTDTSTATNTITARSWKVDGVEFSTATNPTYEFNTAGLFDISLTVTSSDGSDTLTRTNYIEVYEPPTEEYITAAFTGTPLNVTLGGTPVTFTDGSSSSSTITARSWKVNGVEFSTATNPTWTPTAIGTYTISLTVTSAVGSDTLTRTAYVTVLAPADPGGGENSLTNGDFATGDYTGWTTYTAGSANFSVSGGEAVIAVSNVGGNTQLYQRGLQIVAGEDYSYSAELACASGTMTVVMRVMQHKSPYNSIIEETVTVTTTPTVHTFDATAAWNYSDMRVTFLIRSTGTLYVDDVSFGRPSQPTEPDPPTVPGGGGSDAARFVMADLNTSTGNQTLTLPSGFTPTACMAAIVPAYTGANPADGDAFGLGFALDDGTAYCAGYSHKHNDGTTQVARRTRNDALVRIPAWADVANDLVEVDIVSMADGQVVINVVTAPASAYKILLVAFAATEAEIQTVAPSTSVSGTATISNTMAGTPDLLIAWTAAGNTNNFPSSADNDALTMLGISGRGSGQYAYYRELKDGQAAASVGAMLKSGRFLLYGNGTGEASVSHDATGATLTTEATDGSWNGTAIVLLLRFTDTNVKVIADTPPATATTKNHATGQRSGLALALSTMLTSLASYQSDGEAGAFGIGASAGDGSSQGSLSVASEDAADPTDNQSSFSATKIVDLPQHDGSAGYSGAVDSTSDTVLTIDYDAVLSRQIVIVSIQGEQDLPPIDMFRAFEEFGLRYQGGYI